MAKVKIALAIIATIVSYLLIGGFFVFVWMAVLESLAFVLRLNTYSSSASVVILLLSCIFGYNSTEFYHEKFTTWLFDHLLNS